MLQNNIKNFLKALRSQFLQIGNQKQCLVCGKSFLFFLSAGKRSKAFKKHKVIGAGHRKNVLCPECYSLDRSRLLFLFLTRHIDISNNQYKSILHVSPQHEFEDFFMSFKDKEYITIDIEPNKAMLEMDLCKLEFKSNYFDLIICNHVLEQIVNERLAIKELLRVLKPQGKAIIQSPIAMNLQQTIEKKEYYSEEERERLLGQSDMVRLYGLDYTKRFEDLGFVSEVIFQENFLDLETRIKSGLNLLEPVYVFNK